MRGPIQRFALLADGLEFLCCKVGLVDVVALILEISEALFDEVLALLADEGLLWEIHVVSVEDDSFPQDLVLGHVVPERSFAVEHLEENDSH